MSPVLAGWVPRTLPGDEDSIHSMICSRGREVMSFCVQRYLTLRGSDQGLRANLLLVGNVHRNHNPGRAPYANHASLDASLRRFRLELEDRHRWCEEMTSA